MECQGQHDAVAAGVKLAPLVGLNDAHPLPMLDHQRCVRGPLTDLLEVWCAMVESAVDDASTIVSVSGHLTVVSCHGIQRQRIVLHCRMR